MASGKPPRRTSSKDDPVTIDLEAERNEPVSHDEGTKPEELVADEPEPTAPKPDSAENESGTSDQSSSFAGSSESTSPIRSTKGGPSTSGLIAAGIFGGIVALAGAGALQYAGYLPAMGPSLPQTSQENTELVQQLAALENRVTELSSTTAPAQDTSELEARMASLEEAMRSVTQTQPDEVGASRFEELQQKLVETSEALAMLRSEVENTAQSVTQAETRLDQRLTAAEEKFEEPRSDVELARAVALTSLKSAIDRGGPFLTELDTLASLTPDDPTVSQLQQHASTGVASRAELVRGFPDIADSILAAIRQPEGDGGLGQRLLSSAFSVIKVRPVGNVEGTEPEAIVARMEDKLRNGDLKGAQLEWQQLPEAGKSASAEFAETLEKRIEVEALVGTALAEVMNGKG